MATKITSRDTRIAFPLLKTLELNENPTYIVVVARKGTNRPPSLEFSKEEIGKDINTIINEFTTSIYYRWQRCYLVSTS
ncbi:hypothetical protein [Desulfurococcus amylolyticus]|uniref:hypothetical protein n=1 Tax=Desulfurococcus amylolyticus TaxID=94694 RepID=UPI0005B202CE|nr:hypothetical protein [Desulfurococcus amylolyticus]